MSQSTIDRLTSLGGGVLGKASQDPRAARVLQGAAQVRDRLDDLQKRVRGLESLERRLDALEDRVAKLESAEPERARRSAKKAAEATEE